jgi:hypothetical protein
LEFADEFADEPLFEFVLLICSESLIFNEFWIAAPVLKRDEPYLG